MSSSASSSIGVGVSAQHLAEIQAVPMNPAVEEVDTGFMTSSTTTSISDMDVPSTLFEEVVAAVPQLALACSAELLAEVLVDDVLISTSGRKLMRLISKKLRVVMLGLVSCYTINLDGEKCFNDEWSVLSVTRLKILDVTITFNPSGKWY